MSDTKAACGLPFSLARPNFVHKLLHHRRRPENSLRQRP
jgi:hypothetical protein